MMEPEKSVSDVYASLMLILTQMEAKKAELKDRMQKFERWPWEENQLRKQLEDMFRVHEGQASTSVDPIDVLLLALESKLFTPHAQNETGPRGSFVLDNMKKYILQSMGTSLHATSHSGKIIYWNHTAEQLFGYTAEEALGQISVELLCSEYMQDSALAIAARVWMGDSWTGQFPMKRHTGEVFMALISCSPLTDDNDHIVGVVTVSIPCAVNECKDPHRHMYVEHLQSLSETTEAHFRHRGKQESQGMQQQQNLLESSGRDLQSPWKINRNPAIWHPRPDHAYDWATRYTREQRSVANGKGVDMGILIDEKFLTRSSNHNDVERRLDPSSSNNNNSRSNSSGSGRGYELLELQDVEIQWGEIELGQKVGQGSCGTVYHGSWLGSDVAVKVFSQQAQNPKLLNEFRREVAIMKRLSHPNILLFMGVVTAAEPENLSIVTEFLPHGSLYRLLHRKSAALTWSRRLQMALDIALGMNYLHHRKPPIIHRDLKSSNLLVGRNWTVKVGDFGLSRLKNSAYLTRKCDKGTAQWMAPEVLRNEPFTEKSDIFSFGVILWELATDQIPWLEYNFLEVIGAVGIMDRRLEIPDNVDPQWVKLIKACWSSNPKLRPSFDRLVSSLKAMQQARMSTRSTGQSSRAQDTLSLS